MLLLTAYADTEAAIRSINKTKIDYYLMKPWDPPEKHLYPILDDLLDFSKPDTAQFFSQLQIKS
jgi:thioredoxin reductase (NADPH)